MKKNLFMGTLGAFLLASCQYADPNYNQTVVVNEPVQEVTIEVTGDAYEQPVADPDDSTGTGSDAITADKEARYGVVKVCPDGSNSCLQVSIISDSTGVGSDAKIFDLKRPVKFVIKNK